MITSTISNYSPTWRACSDLSDCPNRIKQSLPFGRVKHNTANCIFLSVNCGVQQLQEEDAKVCALWHIGGTTEHTYCNPYWHSTGDDEGVVGLLLVQWHRAHVGKLIWTTAKTPSNSLIEVKSYSPHFLGYLLLKMRHLCKNRG